MFRMLLLGAHLSIEGGHHRAIEKGKKLRCTALQIFTKNQIRWSSKPIVDRDVELFKDTLRENKKLKVIVAHGSYLLNFASPDEDLISRSIQSLLDELHRCYLLGIPYVIIHPGAHMGLGESKGMDKIISSLEMVLIKDSSSAVICIETTAGQGTGIGYRFEHLRDIIKSLDEDRIGACLDTCHVFAAGYDVSSKEGYEETIEEFDRTVGLKYLKVIHLNDSKGGLGSRVDRHMHIGKGAIGKVAFTCIMQDARFKAIPKIIETPKKLEKREMDRVNLKFLRSLAHFRNSES